MEIENVAGVRFTAGRTLEQQRQRTVSNCVLGQIVVNHQNVLALLHEMLAHCTARIGGDVLKGSQVGGCRGNYNGILHCVGFFQAVGMAIGAGADAAIASADVVLRRSDPRDVVSALTLGRRTMRIVRQNLFWALIYNAVCIPVAAGALVPLGVSLSPGISAAAMCLSSLFVVSNSLRLYRKS